MWLLNAESRKLEYFEGARIPPYAILSHRWEEEEVLYAEIEHESAQKKKGYQKIDYTCREALREGLGYVWVDTACIDKKSSAELSEAINSMFKWYRNAAVCYVYLSDVDTTEVGSAEACMQQFKSSAWFSRGWTLQELLAPTRINFFDTKWKPIGTRTGLLLPISEASGIGMIELEACEKGQIDRFCAAQKMSWAVQRQTTRVEDEAYCLLGLFGVNMPLLYGEGRQAFRRLQEEILRNSGDITIFSQSAKFFRRQSLFAESPQFFLRSGYHTIVRITDSQEPHKIFVWAGGVSLTVRLRVHAYGVYLLPVHYDSTSDKLVCLELAKTLLNSDLYELYEDNPLVSVQSYFQLPINFEAMRLETRHGWFKRSIDLSASVAQRGRPRHTRYYGPRDILYYGFHFLVPDWMSSDRPEKLTFVSRATCSEDNDHFTKYGGQFLALRDTQTGLAGVLEIQSRERGTVRLFMGFDFDFNAFCLAIRTDKLHPGKDRLGQTFRDGSTVSWFYAMETILNGDSMRTLSEPLNDSIIDGIYRMRENTVVTELFRDGVEVWRASEADETDRTMRLDNGLDMKIGRRMENYDGKAKWITTTFELGENYNLDNS